MNISANALDLIKEFEGLRLHAYIDPVGIPTIGYGTIRYPDSGKVRMEDSISESEAEAFLKFECDKIARDVSAIMSGIKVNQNQFDALVSFCYNVGFGALRDSTLLKKLKSSDFDGAANEFPRWNKGTINGVKTELPGLTKRRAKEKALFEKKSRPGKPLLAEESDQERVVMALGFNISAVNIVAGFDNNKKVVEIIELENNLPATLIALLNQYPNLKNFSIADANARVPAGKRKKFSGLARPMAEVKSAPKLNRKLLALGAEDSEDFPGNDVRELQTRLFELGYYKGAITGVFDSATDSAAIDFQADYFGRAEADGKVGPLTWKKLWGEVKAKLPATGAQQPGKHYLKLTNTGIKDRLGLNVLLLEYFKNGVAVDSLEVCSGARRSQTFRIGKKSQAGSMEPLPEGKWFVRNIEWVNGKDNYSSRVWNNGLGPAKIRLDYKKPSRTKRSAIQIHIDWNRSGAPGTAGCIGIRNTADFKTLVTWLRDTDPRDLFVDWNLGTCPKP